MIIFWGILLGLPLFSYGFCQTVYPDKTRRWAEKFCLSRFVAIALTLVAWAWTAWECHALGLEVFDRFLKISPFQLPIMALICSVLTVKWMRQSLSMRALMAILMLIPAELFRTTRFYLPESGFGAVHFFVVFAYLGAIIGMYGMFYPWRIEKALAWIQVRQLLARSLGVMALCGGLTLLSVGFYLH